ncbi:RagB/SusD family nutrient uptake outer membrane protein [Pedobacter sp. LMG 31464]|uniref:RagB/SusD family nutrient uptake outer membrane protein n=1 Tax=Pedobacter planticolens TaxID=2679964 RepID=A0A923IWD7_9SPHI|nr:RagB/SusD family nutrient uptake outer membrane protein [Pedobacter planticolens]MBB2146803.1 RagB/SusD family nutrient uptake outer membrane protein [Pedobacter planticolens]
MLLKNFNMKRKFLMYLFLLGVLFSQVSCKKLLEEKPIKAQVVPTTTADFQAMLDGHIIMNDRYPNLQVVGGDDYYVTDADFDASYELDRDNYIWNSSSLTAGYSAWGVAYKAVQTSNLILERLPNVNSVEVNNIKGQALFFRSFAFYNVAQIFCKPYSSTSSTDLGIPIVTESAIDTKIFRSTVKETYDRIVSDLKKSIPLLQTAVPASTRPNKTAAYGMLARTYLAMGDYTNAGLYADTCLMLADKLIDFNTLDPNSDAPISRFNTETLFYCIALQSGIASQYAARIDPDLYKSYDQNDLRKSIYFLSNGDGSFQFKGSYDGTTSASALFLGIATDEMKLISAECSAKNGNTNLAMATLNSLLVKRWRIGTFVPMIATSPVEALSKVRTERRKELIFRGHRWSDIRRFNLEGASISITRNIKGIKTILAPNDLRSVFLLPYDVVSINGMPQNPR